MIEETGPCARCRELGRSACRFCDPASVDYLPRPDLSTPEGRNAYVYGRMNLPVQPPHLKGECQGRRCCGRDVPADDVPGGEVPGA